jgi:hypothetical protein
MTTDEIFNEKLKTYYDGRDKEVGDRVIIWDSFACFNEKGDRILVDESIEDRQMIVIDNEISEYVSINYLNIRHLILIDLKLYDTIDKNIVFTNSEFCKIL